MTQDIRLYGSAQVWDQPLQLGQANLLQAIEDFWPSNISTALDVGCGDGKLTARLARQGLELVGLDSSEEALSRVALPTIKGDAQALPCSDDSFDLVMTTDVLEHLPDAEETAAWAELFRVARKAVIVAVPFREEMLDAATRCDHCGQIYHVNWHQRSYDIADLHAHAPVGWAVTATVLSGEAWSAMLPPETHLRRLALNQWTDWDAAICPLCGGAGHGAATLEALPSIAARALGAKLYQALAHQRYCRSHSEILVIFEPKMGTAPILPRQALEWQGEATTLTFSRQQPSPDLEPYCQVARYVETGTGQWRMQFPAYPSAAELEIVRQPGGVGAVDFLLEDHVGILFEGLLFETGQERHLLSLPRTPVPGYYGILATCPADASIAAIRLGQGPPLLWATPQPRDSTGYVQIVHPQGPLFVQVPRQLWIEPEALATSPASVTPAAASLIPAILAAAQTSIADVVGHGPIAWAKRFEALEVRMQNLTAERDALLLRAAEADKLAVEVQNLTAERDALLPPAAETDRLAIELQNLTAERDALLLRAAEADRLAVEVQNLTAGQNARPNDRAAPDGLAERVALLEAGHRNQQQALAAAQSRCLVLEGELRISEKRISDLLQRVEHRVFGAAREAIARVYGQKD